MWTWSLRPLTEEEQDLLDRVRKYLPNLVARFEHRSDREAIDYINELKSRNRSKVASFSEVFWRLQEERRLQRKVLSVQQIPDEEKG